MSLFGKGRKKSAEQPAERAAKTISGAAADGYVYRRPGSVSPPEPGPGQDPDGYVYKMGSGGASPAPDSPDKGEAGAMAPPPAPSGKRSGKASPGKSRKEAKQEQVFLDSSQSDPDYWNKSLERRYQENYPAERRILLGNIRKVAALVLALFLALMSYLVYFQVTRAADLKADSGNRRNAEARNRVLRGALFDRSGEILSNSVLRDDGSQTREYPGGIAFGNILGYASDKFSLTGLELALDKTLAKPPGLESYFSLNFITSLLNPEQAVTKKQQGYSVELTLDKGLQNYAYGALGGRKGSVVALDPRSGEILAMVSSPGFSAAQLDEVMKRVNSDKAYAEGAPLINRAIHSVFAPGSTMKVVTLASALANLPGLEQRIFDDKGIIQFPDGHSISNFNNNVYGIINLQQAFTNSSNYVFGSLGMELSNAQLRETAHGFGFNQEIAMTGMTARPSVFPRLKDTEDGNKALSALGQGEVAATPLQIAMVSAAVANDGKLAAPHIVTRILDRDGATVSREETATKQALEPAIAAKVRQLMAGNVATGGSAYRSLASIDGAGKTGTGQFAVGAGTRVHSWFTGFAPQADPKIAIVVMVEDLADTDENTGARQALPIARDVMAWWLNR